jgi:hypothetical protein
MCVALPVAAQSPSPVQEAKNPLANLVNLQFLYDANLNVGSPGGTQDAFTFEPLIPFDLNANWSIITRTMLPVIWQPGLAPGQNAASGTGDTQLSAFLSPARAGQWVWGVGPVFQVPTASNTALGQGKWGAGPTAAAQWTGTLWTFGALINNIWSVAGSGSRPAVNQMQLQPEINFSFPSDPNGYLSFSPTIVANWTASGDERWTAPVSLGVGQLLKIGKQSVNLQATAYYNLVAPAGTGNWTLELELQLLFPH